jgi:hypothetical protein
VSADAISSHDEDDREREQRAHRDVEDSQPATTVNDVLDAAPKASHRKQLGKGASTKRPPSTAACTIALPASALRKVPAALAVTSHDFGLTH